MIIKRISLTLFLSICFSVWIMAQITPSDPQSIISDILEDITASSESDVDIDALAEDLLFFLDNPINLNLATYEELSRLIFLSDFQIQSILDYVKTNGQMLTVYELQLVYGFDYIEITRI